MVKAELDLKERVRTAEAAVDGWVAEARADAAADPSPEANQRLLHVVAVSDTYRNHIAEMVQNWFLLVMAIGAESDIQS